MWRLIGRWLGAVAVMMTLQLAAVVAQEDAGGAELDGEEVQAVLEQEAGAGAPAAPGAGAIYIPLKPAFVVNYGGPGRLKYIKADISVRLDDPAAANSLRHHMPYIRNNLVMLLSAQTEESISSQEGKEALRKEALQEVREVIMAEDQQQGVVDLYFNTFLLQK